MCLVGLVAEHRHCLLLQEARQFADALGSGLAVEKSAEVFTGRRAVM